MLTQVFGHELRLEVSRERVASEVCWNDDAVLVCQGCRREGLEGKGWAK
jgi:predicted Fe-S protein YdhL (DUF1289 family)